MKSVSAHVVSSKPVSLAAASRILSNFVSMENGASHAVSVYLRRAATSFANLNQFHKDLKSSSSTKSLKKHSQIIAFDFGQDETEIKGEGNEVEEIEGNDGIEVEKSEVNKKKKKRKGEEIEGNFSGESAEQSGLSKKKRRKTEGD
ncbi:hypothetical protein DCAR_0312694 [Daucus carota subsp. sativus]|uniref:Uncharacterized protein n=1 Tax=Daucus carota subsp. sativus TaxID=79200 RepID=A0A162AKK9_DAUCS|nr:PREDICTED: uncharacterized protein LOC108212593 [Daucus carota subsp. sativus]XP_017242102.1 PREDICTED: uncharacterized protein LOC108214550 [Daucus carota subsp. sativus]WOG93410.1 hypothetical protein DCAR_0312694 [Daucus carota subsp. sativus]